jgi:histidyl-tRNA synthetase
MGIARAMRAAGIAVTFDFFERKIKKAMAMASQSGARFALIVGDDEVAQGRYALKNLATGEQQTLALNEIIKFTKDFSYHNARSFRED